MLTGWISSQWMGEPISGGIKSKVEYLISGMNYLYMEFLMSWYVFSSICYFMIELIPILLSFFSLIPTFQFLFRKYFFKYEPFFKDDLLLSFFFLEKTYVGKFLISFSSLFLHLLILKGLKTISIEPLFCSTFSLPSDSFFLSNSFSSQISLLFPPTLIDVWWALLNCCFLWSHDRNFISELVWSYLGTFLPISRIVLLKTMHQSHLNQAETLGIRENLQHNYKDQWKVKWGGGETWHRNHMKK